jgi:hypothetical protein
METALNSSTRARSWRLRVIAALLATTVTLLFAEGAARLLAVATGRGRAVNFDAELGWRPLPNLSKQGDYWGITRPARTNSHGWRDSEHAGPKPAGVRRAVLLGDSFAFGLGVDDGERVSDLIEQAFQRLEVLNMGVTAWGTDQQLRALELDGFAYAPDIVVLLTFPHNDLDDVRRERNCSWPKPHFDLVNGELRLVKPRLTWDVRLRSLSYCAEFIYDRLRTKDTDARMVAGWESRDAIPLYAAIVQRMAEECTAKGVRMVAVIAYPPERLEAGPSEAEKRARAALEDAGFAVCDTLDAFREHARTGESLYLKGDFHWNARGNAVAAEELRKMLLGLGWLQ